MSYKRHAEDQKRMKKLLNNFKGNHLWTTPVYFNENEEGKIYYYRIYKTRNSIKYLKHQSNIKIRRYKGDLKKRGNFKKVYDIQYLFY